MRDRTAQTEPLTAGQQIVSAWETDIIAEPCELAECIDNRIAAAVKAERESCALIADAAASYIHNSTAEQNVANGIANDIRDR